MGEERGVQSMAEFEIIAHRGFSAIAPENTLAAFAAAIYHKADSIEFDVQLSSDGVPVIIHDATLDRTTNDTGKVRDKTWEQLKSLDVGSWFNPKFSQERIPTLKAALTSLKQLPKFIYPEVKGAEFWSSADVDLFVQTLIETGWENKSIVACFNHRFLTWVRERSPHLTLGYLVDNPATYTTKLAKAAADGNAIMLSKYSILLDNPSLVETSRREGVDVGVWTVDQEEDFQQLVNIGIGRIITNSLVGRRELFAVEKRYKTQTTNLK